MKSAALLLIPVMLIACTKRNKTVESDNRQVSPVARATSTDDGFNKYVENVQQPVPKQPIIKSEDPLPIELTPTQTFSINASRDTTLVCKAGTKISIPSYALMEEETGNPVTGNVVLSVNEFYSNTDIFMAQLTTSSKGEMIESGGMVYIGAASNNKSCALQQGKQIQLTFPRKENKPGMQVFYGTRKDNGMDWSTSVPAGSVIELAPPLEPIEETEPEIYDLVSLEEMPTFKANSSDLKEYLRRSLRYPPTCKEAGIEGKVYVEFTIDQLGKVGDVKIKRGVHPELDGEVIRVIKQMPDWNPGKINGKAVKTRYVQPVSFKVGDGDGGNQFSYNYVRPEVKTNIENANTNIVSQNDINAYVISSSSLGWINCDRFIKVENKAILAVNETNENTIIGLVFHDYKSYLRSNYFSGTEYRFNGIPANEKVTMIACKKENGINYISVTETNTNAANVTPVYKQVTLEELKKEIAKLNNSENTEAFLR